jgi:hypothetical protein
MTPFPPIEGVNATLQSKVVAMQAMPQFINSPNQASAIAGSLNTPSESGTTFIHPSDVMNVVLRNNVLKAIKVSASSTTVNATTSAADAVLELLDPNKNHDPIDVTDAEILAWFSNLLGSLVTGNIFVEAVKTEILALRNTQVSWAFLTFGRDVTDREVDLNRL